MDTIAALAPDSPTACAGWTLHEIVAHLAAGSKERADLTELRCDGRPDRPTRRFEEREAAFRAMPHDELMRRFAEEVGRKDAAQAALEQLDDPSISFTGTRITASELTTHSRSEAAIHHWDLVGDDDFSDSLLAQPELTAHALKVLNRMPVLNESASTIASRSGRPMRVAFRSPGEPDVVFVVADGGGRFDFSADDTPADASVTTSAANRLLLLWGRRSSMQRIELNGDDAVVAVLPAAFWPHAQPWPPAV